MENRLWKPHMSEVAYKHKNQAQETQLSNGIDIAFQVSIFKSFILVGEVTTKRKLTVSNFNIAMAA